jgi:hypothetical protein
MADLQIILVVLAGIFILVSFISASHGSGYMPGSGYKEEAFWGKVSLTLLFLGFGCIVLMIFF